MWLIEFEKHANDMKREKEVKKEEFHKIYEAIVSI